MAEGRRLLEQAISGKGGMLLLLEGEPGCWQDAPG